MRIKKRILLESKEEPIHPFELVAACKRRLPKYIRLGSDDSVVVGFVFGIQADKDCVFAWCDVKNRFAADMLFMDMVPAVSWYQKKIRELATGREVSQVVKFRLHDFLVIPIE